MPKIPAFNEVTKVVNEFITRSAQQINYRKTLLADMKYDRSVKEDLARELTSMHLMMDDIKDLNETLKNAGPALAKMEILAKKDAATLEVALKAGGAAPPIKANAPFIKDLLDAMATVQRRLDFARVESTKAKVALSSKNDLKTSLRPGNMSRILNGLDEMSQELAKAHDHVKSLASQFAHEFS